MKSMKNYENVFLDSQTRLLVSIAMFRRSCQELVQDLPDTKVRELVELRTGWDSEELRDKLKWRLKEDFGIYMMSVKQLNKKIDLLRRKLKLREDLSVSGPLRFSSLFIITCWQGLQVPFIVGDTVDEKLRKDFFKKSWTRIRGGFNAERHKQLVAEIRDDIDLLCNFTKGTIEFEETTQQQPSSAISTYWLNLRSHADGLYNALSSIWPQSCATHHHQAKLRLDLPNSTTNYEVAKLNLAFLKGHDTTSASLKSLPREWRDVTILSLDSK